MILSGKTEKNQGYYCSKYIQWFTCKNKTYGMEESLTCNPFGSKTYCTRTFTNIFADGVSRYRLCADAGITEEIEGHEFRGC